MKSLIIGAAIASAIALSSPVLAQDAANDTSATGTTAKSMQADNTKPHMATKTKHHKMGMNDSSTMNDSSAMNANGMNGSSTMKGPSTDNATGGH